MLLNRKWGQWVENGSVMKPDFLFCVGFQILEFFLLHTRMYLGWGGSSNLLQQHNF